MNFISTFDELNKLYEELPAEEAVKKADKLVEEEIEDEEIEIVDDEAAAQVVIECTKCGALAIKNKADIKSEDTSDVVNVDEACAFCEEQNGYKVIGSFIPSDPAEEPEEAEEIEVVEEGLFDKKAKNVKFVDARSLKAGDKALYYVDKSFKADLDAGKTPSAASYFDPKGKKPVSVFAVDATSDDRGDDVDVYFSNQHFKKRTPNAGISFDDIVAIEECFDAKGDKPLDEADEMKELFDASISLGLNGGQGNDVNVL